MIFAGPEAERRYGYRHFLELLSVFSSPLQFLVVHGRRELGTADPFVLTRKVIGPRVIALAGRGWLVNAVDWARRKAYVIQLGHGCFAAARSFSCVTLDLWRQMVAFSTARYSRSKP